MTTLRFGRARGRCSRSTGSTSSVRRRTASRLSSRPGACAPRSSCWTSSCRGSTVSRWPSGSPRSRSRAAGDHARARLHHQSRVLGRIPDLSAGVMPDAAADLAAGLALIAAGAVMLVQRPRRDAGWLLTLAGVTWFAGDVWTALLYAHRGPLVHALLTYPSGRTRSPLIITVVVAAYVDGLVPGLARSP